MDKNPQKKMLDAYFRGEISFRQVYQSCLEAQGKTPDPNPDMETLRKFHKETIEPYQDSDPHREMRELESKSFGG